MSSSPPVAGSPYRGKSSTERADNQLPANVRDIGRTSCKKAFSEPFQTLENQRPAEGQNYV